MLRTATTLTKREQEFLTWLLEPQLFGQRVPGPTKRDVKKLAGAIRQLQRVGPGVLTIPIEYLEGDLAQLKQEVQTKRTVYRSAIQSTSHDGAENIEGTQRFFLATLIARKRGAKPYEFLFARFKNPHFASAKAIELRVGRFEQRLETSGPVSCSCIAHRLYSQFLTLRRQERLRQSLVRYLQGRMSYQRYCEVSERFMMPNARETRWLDSLCAYARAHA